MCVCRWHGLSSSAVFKSWYWVADAPGMRSSFSSQELVAGFKICDETIHQYVREFGKTWLSKKYNLHHQSKASEQIKQDCNIFILFLYLQVETVFIPVSKCDKNWLVGDYQDRIYHHSSSNYSLWLTFKTILSLSEIFLSTSYTKLLIV